MLGFTTIPDQNSNIQTEIATGKSTEPLKSPVARYKVRPDPGSGTTY